jgi:acetyl-CoA decarbonylase/synthase complex subunit gamma
VHRPTVPPETPWTDGTVETPVGPVARVRTTLSLRDHLGTLRVRVGSGRRSYAVPPGLYAAGTPSAEAPVLVSANYKLSFDHLRSHLVERGAWILVLDTRGINVWCAAGKGTFGTDEVVRQIREVALNRVVSHRRLVLPQLGAPGVAAHFVRAATGFRVTYGPVRAEDLPAFLDGRMKASPAMRQVQFGLADRIILAPVEVVLGARKAVLIALLLLALSGIGPRGYSWGALLDRGLPGAALLLAAFVLAGILGPALLPWLPGRAFAVKGAALGLGLAVLGGLSGGVVGGLALVAWGSLVTALASFVVMNFTGATTFTSLSGVLAEMRWAVPTQLGLGGLGLVLWLVAAFV